MKFGDWLRQLRNERGFSQSKLGAMAGVSNQYISDMENGKRNCPTGPVLARMAAALNVTVDYLLMSEKPDADNTLKRDYPARTAEYEALELDEKKVVDELTKEFERTTSRLLYMRKHGHPPE